MKKWTQRDIDKLKERGITATESTSTPTVPVKKKHKYGAVKKCVDGILFDSTKEAGWYIKLKDMERKGLIQDLRLQVKFVLIEKSQGERGCSYVADFVYNENGVQVVADVKSSVTRKNRAYVIKRKLLLERYGIKITEL